MPKFARPNSYTGKQGNQNWTGQARFANETEAEAGTSEELIISPATLASSLDTLVPHASTTAYGVVQLTDNSEPVATKVYVDAIAIAGAPVATETVAGIGELATDAEAVAGTPSTGVKALLVTPSNLTPVFAAPPAIGGTTPAGATFTGLTADGTGQVSLGSNAAADITASAGDVSLISSAGSIVLNGAEAVDDAIQLTSGAGGLAASLVKSVVISSSETNADSVQLTSAGGMDLTATGAAGKDVDIVCTSGSINLTAGESAADSIKIVSSAGGIDILASGASAGEDIDIVATGSSVNITSTENNAGAIIVQANGGASERVTLLSSQGTGADSINLESTAGGITLSAALASADAINLAASAGGVDVDGALQVNIASSQAAANAVRIVASNAAGGLDLDCGTGGATLDSTGAISLDAAAASNFAVSGAGIDLTLDSAAGQLILTGGEAAANAVRIQADDVAGGIDVDAGTGGIAIDSTGAISLDGAAASNFTVTGAFDLTLATTAGSANLTAGEAAADAIRINASDVAGGIDIDCGSAGAALDSTGAISLDGAAASNFSVTGAGIDLTLASAAGRAVMTGGEAAADAIRIQASDAAGGIDADAGTGGIALDATGASHFTLTGAVDLTLSSSAGSVIVSAGESAADSIKIESTAGGIDILASGAAAGEDIDIAATGSSVNISSSEAVGDAIVLNASNAAGGIDLSAGTGGISLQSGLIVKVTSVVTGVDASPYALLGSDYVLSVDTSAGVMTITLPAAPATGRTVVIYDAGGAAAGSNITIDGNGKNIAAGGSVAGTKAINTAYESYTLYYNGTLWLGQNVV